MQLSRAKGKDGRRESFDGVFNRIDTEGQSFLYIQKVREQPYERLTIQIIVFQTLVATQDKTAHVSWYQLLTVMHCLQGKGQ